MIKYLYALSEDNEIVRINSLDKDEPRKTFRCLSCKNELIPKLGDIRAWHFAHKMNVDCSSETYLHLLAKTFFINNYKKCLQNSKPFLLEYEESVICTCFFERTNRKCELNERISKFDLTSKFECISLEKSFDGFVPDIRLHSEYHNETIFIEFAVTHKSEKLKIGSNYRIIEYLIESEDDLEVINNPLIPFDNEQILLHNFKLNEVSGDHCSGVCKSTHQVFLLYNTLKTRISNLTLEELINLNDSNSLKKYSFIEYSQQFSLSEYYIMYLIAYFEEGLSVRNCFLCRYHAKNKKKKTDLSYKPIFCKFLKSTFNSNDAVECSAYRPDKNVYNQYRI
ncbi:MAG: hypothetical protein JJ958_10515 [Balneola sp.]|nr:hypothetical protein [Balneola sp.]